jgi:putative membrane protein
MIIQIILAILIGIILGTFTGLIPGIHVNLIAVLSITFLNQNLNPEILIIFLIVMGLTHTFIDFIPSVYLGAPDEDTALSILPGHKYLLKGQGHKAIQLTTAGSQLAIFILILLIPVIYYIIPSLINPIEKMMSWILFWIIFFLIKDTENKTETIIIFFLAGILGIASLNSSTNQPLLPLLTGLFGLSTIVQSINSKSKVPLQKIEKLELNKKQLIKPLIGTALISPFCSFLPGLGSSQAAIISSKIIKRINKDQFLILVGSINTLIFTSSIFILYFLNKKRTGIAQALSQISINSNQIITITIIILIISPILNFITLRISKKISDNIHKIEYKKISKVIMIFLIIIVFIISGFSGLLILLTATTLGMLCNLFNVQKNFLMGCLLIPTFIHYLPF